MLSVVFTGFLFGSVAALEAPDPALLEVRRVYVDPLTGGEDAARIRDLIITAIQNSKAFTITENPDKADTFLRGAAAEDAYQEKFSSSERLNGRTFVGGVSGNRKYSDGKSKIPVDVSVGEDESLHLEERKHEAMATVRLVDKAGDVIWSTTKESTGAKFRGAAADVADKVAKQLLADIEKLRQIRVPSTQDIPKR
jgi:hypothetical protein